MCSMFYILFYETERYPFSVSCDSLRLCMGGLWTKSDCTEISNYSGENGQHQHKQEEKVRCWWSILLWNQRGGNFMLLDVTVLIWCSAFLPRIGGGWICWCGSSRNSSSYQHHYQGDSYARCSRREGSTHPPIDICYWKEVIALHDCIVVLILTEI